MSTTLKCDDGDLYLSNNGRFIVVNGIEKCAQDIAESLLNNWDSGVDQYFNGSELHLLQGSSGISAMAVEEQIRTYVEDAVFRLMDLQQADNYVDDDELIEDIRELWVQRLGVANSYAFFLRVITESELDVPMNFDIKLSQMLPAGVSGAEDLLDFSPPNQGQADSIY